MVAHYGIAHPPRKDCSRCRRHSCSRSTMLLRPNAARTNKRHGEGPIAYQADQTSVLADQVARSAGPANLVAPAGAVADWEVQAVQVATKARRRATTTVVAPAP